MDKTIYIVTEFTVEISDGELTDNSCNCVSVFTSLEDAAEYLEEAFENVKCDMLDCNDEGEVEVDEDGYTEDGYGRAYISGSRRFAEVSRWDSSGGDKNVYQIEISENTISLE